MTQTAGKPRPIMLALIAVVVIGAGLRVYRLGSESLWLDEAYSIFAAHLPAPDIVPEISRDVHPPLYYYLLHFWMMPFGDSEFAARMLSVVFGVIAIVMVYRIGSVLFDRRTGLCAAVLMAASHFNIEYSQEARMYELLTLLAAISFWFFLKFLKRDSSVPILVAYILSTSLLTYTQVYSLFVVVAENLFFGLLVFSSRELFFKKLGRWCLSQVTIGVLFLPWFLVLRKQIAAHKSFWIHPPTMAELAYAWRQLAGSHALFLLLAPLAALPIIWVALTARSKARSTDIAGRADQLPLSDGERVVFLVLWLICPVLLPFAASHFVTPFFLAKYTICASVAFVLLAARGLTILPWRSVSIGLFAVFVLLASLDMRRYWTTPRKDRWREAVAFFNVKAQPGDLVVFTEYAGRLPFEYYSRHRDLPEEGLSVYNDEFNEKTVGQVLKPVVSDHDRVWLVLSHQVDLCKVVIRQMSVWYDIVEHHQEAGVELYLYQKRKYGM